MVNHVVIYYYYSVPVLLPMIIISVVTLPCVPRCRLCPPGTYRQRGVKVRTRTAARFLTHTRARARIRAAVHTAPAFPFTQADYIRRAVAIPTHTHTYT